MNKIRTIVRGSACLAATFCAASMLSAQTSFPVTEWAFENGNAGNFTLDNAGDGSLTLSSETTSTGDVRLRGHFPRVHLGVGANIQLSGNITITHPANDDDFSIAGGETRWGLFDELDQGGEIDGSFWTGSQDGLVGYLLTAPTGSAGMSNWDAGETGGAIVGAHPSSKGNTWVSTFGTSVGLGGERPTPEDATPSEEGGPIQVLILIERESADVSTVSYIFSQGNEYQLMGFVIDNGVNDDGSVATTSFNSVGFRFNNSSFSLVEFDTFEITVTGEHTIDDGSGGGTPTPTPTPVPTPTPTPGEDYLGYAVDGGWADTANWLGYLYVEDAPWTYQLTLGWIWIAEDSHSELGGWFYSTK